MTKTLCLDFGNTRLKAAIFEDDIFKVELELADDSNETIKKLLDQYKPQKSILSSVIKHNEGIETMLSEQTSYHKLSHLTNDQLNQP
jgi:type III pantothenate kinase